ncbi:tetratricopeptide repeat protein [Saccharothrix sp. ST-888]|uniref:tetratricopeptide repeat protein n=1 Tax=Saccharothrix sp. ST-888 TaxID=1427391 RepID=UPI0018CDDD14|nr:tetratricopeptide repeat protein [Saccharothrix sp. ST-888]
MSSRYSAASSLLSWTVNARQSRHHGTTNRSRRSSGRPIATRAAPPSVSGRLEPTGIRTRGTDHDAPRPDGLEAAEELARRGMRLAHAGDLQGALPLLRAAVERAQGLPAGDSPMELRLAVFRNDLGLVLAWLGRPAEALAPVAEAIATYRRQLAVAARPGTDPGTVRLLLANSLDSLATRLASLGRHRDAVRAAEDPSRTTGPGPPGGRTPNCWNWPGP